MLKIKQEATVWIENQISHLVNEWPEIVEPTLQQVINYICSGSPYGDPEEED